MFDLTKDQLAELGDTDLRELLARLCEAEVGSRGGPRSSVRWGGRQTAPDGGVDVEVRGLPQGFARDRVPRPWTVVQSKKTPMARAAIRGEMAPDGAIRPVIAELAREGGAYIMACLADATAAQVRER